MTLDDLANQEMLIHKGIEAAWNEKRKLSEDEESNHFRTYATIYQEYLGLARDGNVEALKRAFFIQWFGFIEPMYLTGINIDIFDVKDKDLVLSEIEKRIQTKTLDQEFGALIHWAYSIVDFYFDGKVEFPTLKKYLSEIDKAADLLGNLDATKMRNRGILGDYYHSIFESKLIRESEPE